MARAIAEQLTVQLAGGQTAKGSGRPTENLAAYNLYLQGRYHLNQRTEEGLRKAVEFFDKAIVEDAQYAHAYSGLADAYSLLGHYGVLAPAEVWTKTASNAAWAVLAGRTFGGSAHLAGACEIHAGLGLARGGAGISARPQPGSRDIPRRTIGTPCPAWRRWGGWMKRARKCLLAQALDPISSIIARDLARVHYYRQDFEAALEQCDHTIELNPHFSPAYWILGLVQEQRGEFDESVAAFQRAIQISPRSPIMQAALGRTFALSGKRAGGAAHPARNCTNWRRSGMCRRSNWLRSTSRWDRSDEGFEWLSKAFQDRCFELISLRVDPRWQSLKGDPQFHQLFSRLGLP